MSLEPLYSADEMRAAEACHPGYPDSMRELMERAGTQAAATALDAFVGARAWTIVCGAGSNGGDGRVMAERLRAEGHEVRVVEAKSDDHELGAPDVLVDALFGTGFSGEPRPDAARLIERMNDSARPIFAIDLPSGVDASTGEIAGAATVT